MHGTLARFVLLLGLLLPALSAQPLAGTEPLTDQVDFARNMVDGIHRYLDRMLADAPGARQQLWNRDYSSPSAYERSVAGNRDRLAKILGVIDSRLPASAPSLVATVAQPALVGENEHLRILAVRWPVLPGVDGEGLLLSPKGTATGRAVVLPDAGQTPEQFTGLAEGSGWRWPLLLANAGVEVIVPALIDRQDRYSGNALAGRWTNQPHREFLYRMSYEMGRHIAGYEVQKVLSAVDWFASSSPALPIAVIGHGEGGLIALHAAALDTRIKAALVSGYFQARETVLWTEPVYRNLWGWLREFGDSGAASLIAPRALTVFDAPGPSVSGPPPETPERKGASPGSLASPDTARVQQEFARLKPHFDRLRAPLRLEPRERSPGDVLATFAGQVFPQAQRLAASSTLPALAGRQPVVDTEDRQRRQFLQIVAHVQDLAANSDAVRRSFWAKADTTSLESLHRTTVPYRTHLWEEVIGKLPAATEPLRVRTRKAYEEATWTGYEVLIPVWRDVDAYGILLIPKGVQPGERRPVVVTQHGLEDRPQDLIAPANPADEKVYKRYAARLAEQGFVVYAPQNPYIFEDHFRQIMRKANPLKLTLFSFILGQHERTLDWLVSLPFVDPARIGFYGLSYGGKTAMRVPSLLDRYALSICSADFNEWIWKITSVTKPFSYMYTREYDMLEFDLGNTFNYAEMAALIAPRPFMVERGHQDGVSIDEWVAYEYARVRRFYDGLAIGDKTAIEFFDGPHSIHAVGTFEFLRRHLNWPPNH